MSRAALAGIMRGVALPAVVAMPVLMPVAAAAQEAARSYSIPPGPLDAALNRFGREAGILLSYTPDMVAGLSSAGLQGSHTVMAGLQALLAPNRLQAVRTPGGTYALRALPQVGSTEALPPVIVEARAWRESAWGPADGYVARRSGTGTKTDTPLIETPQTINVVTSKQVERQAAQTVNQALRYTAGVTTDFIGTGPYDNPAYTRGFITENYIDGMRQLDNGGFVQAPINDLYNLERIEVLRGPSSVLYGQGTPGGVLNMVSKRPTEEPLREVGVQFGNWQRAQAMVDFSGPVDEDGKLLYRLTAQGLRTHSQFDGDHRERVSFAPALTWRPGANTTWTVLVNYVDEPKTGYLNVVPAVGTIRYSPRGKIDLDRNFSNSDDYVARRSQFSTTSLFEHRFSESFAVRQNFRYRYDKKFQDIYALINGGIYWNLGSDYESYMADTQAEGKLTTGPLSHTVLAGFDYVRGENDYFSAFGFGAGVDPFSPTYRPTRPANYANYRRNSATIDQHGLYVQDQIAFGGFRLLLGGRHDWAESRNRNLVNGDVSSTDDKAFTGRAGLVYLFDNGVAPYASYAESFKPSAGSYSPARGGGAFEPTTGQQYELGVKYQPPGGGLLLTASVYHLTQKNVTTTDPADFDYSIQTGEVRSRGAELEARAAVTADFDLIASASYLDNRITRSEEEDALQGKRPIISPKYSAALWGDYRFARMAPGLRAGGGVRYVGEAWADSANTYKVPAFTLLDATVGYDLGALSPRLAGANIDLAVHNLTDKSYIQSCGAVSDGACFVGQRRTVYATLRYRW